MPAPGPTFIPADLATVASRLDAGSVHLWRLHYRHDQGRAPLRAVLAAYLGMPAAAVTLQEGAGGKPQLAPMAGADTPPLDFNWSHSGDLAVVALARNLALGVDIEQASRRPRSLALAQRYFDRAEAAALAALAGKARTRAFLSLWCAKEAVLKATGAGISFGLERLAFVPDAEGYWRLAHVDAALGAPADWQVRGFAAAPGCHAALAWRGPARAIEAFAAPPPA